MRFRSAFFQLFLLPLLPTVFWAESKPVQDLRITDTLGQVAVMPKGSTKASPATKGMPLQAGDRLITGEKGRVEMGAKEGTVVELKEKSYCRIQNLAPGKTSFFVRVGRMLGRFAPAKTTGISYRIRTPVSVASVRGTDVGVAVSEDGSTEGGVVEGAVDFKQPPNGPDATINWSDEDPRWDDEEKVEASTETNSKVGVSTETTAVETGQGISVRPNAAPEKLPAIPKVIVSELRWFDSVKDRVPKLRDEWKDLDVPSKMKMRQQALRERITWQIPEKFLPPRINPGSVQPQKISPKKHDIPKPK